MYIAVTSRTAIGAVPGDFCNQLQVAASALHLLDLKLDDDLRPLARAGLAAICEAADSARVLKPANSLNLTRIMS